MTESAEKTAPGTAVPETAPERKPMDRGAAVLLLLAFAAAAWFCFGHDFFRGGMGIGLTVTHFALTAAVMVMAGRRGILKIRPSGLFLLILSFMLSTVYAVYANAVMKLLDLPVLLLLTAQALFALTERNAFPALSAQGLWEGARRYAGSLFRMWGMPVRTLKQKSRCRHTDRLAVGILAAAAAGAVAAAVLSTADTVFSGLLESAAGAIRYADGPFFAKLLMCFPLALMLFSHRCSLLEAPHEIRPAAAGAKDPTVIRMVLLALALVYGLFAYVQVRYLFAGVESVRMSGGYAEYARSGFFQLVLVALLTLCLILPSLRMCRDDGAVRVLCALVTVLTGVIDFSAFFRMRLYIGAYGLTTLRIVTLWGIGMILLALLAALIKTARPGLEICPMLAAAALVTWVMLNWANVDRLVADDLVARYNAGLYAREDGVAALASDRYWSPDYYAAFGKITDPDARAAALELLDERGGATDDGERPLREPALYDWSLCYLKLPEERK